MFVTLFNVTSDEGRDAPDASSKRRVVDVKASPRADDLLGRGDFAPRRRPLLRSVVALHFCKPPIRPCLAIMPSFIGRTVTTGFRREPDKADCGPWMSRLVGERALLRQIIAAPMRADIPTINSSGCALRLHNLHV
jgi:hypothetical protein